MKRLLSPLPIAQDAGLTFIRLIVAGFMIYHGAEIFNAGLMNGYLQWDMFKNSSSGKLMAYGGKGAEFVGGIFLLLGLFTRIACLLLIGTLGYIAFFVGHGKVWYDDQHPFLFVLLFFVLFFTGPGKFSLDYFLFGKKE